MRPQRRRRSFARRDQVALGLHLVVGLDHFPFLAQHRALRLDVGLGVQPGGLEEGSEGPGERRRERLRQHVRQRGFRLEREPERQLTELQRQPEQQLQLGDPGAGEEGVPEVK